MLRFILTTCVFAAFAIDARADGYWAGEAFIVPRDGVTLRTRSTQLVSKVLCDVGSQVKKGDILVQFDDKTARIDLQIATLNLHKKELEMKLAVAKLEAAKAGVARTQVDLERTRKLFESKTVTSEEVAKKEAELKAASAELAGAEIQLQIAKVEVDTAKSFLLAEESKIDELTLKAPFDGTIVARYIAVGDLISKADQGLFDLVGNVYLIEAAVPSRLISQLKDKTPIVVALDKDAGEKTFKGQVVLIGPVVDPRTKTIKVHFSIPEAEMKIVKPGMTVIVKVGTQKEND